MDTKNDDGSLTLLDACATIVMFEGADRATISANINKIREALAHVIATDSRDVEPYLAEHLLEMKQGLYELLEVRPEQYARYDSGTWA